MNRLTSRLQASAATFLLLGALAVFPQKVQGQQEDSYVPEVITDLRDSPLFLSGGGHMSRFHDRTSATSIKPGPGWSFGFLTEYSLFQTTPFLWGLELESSHYQLSRYTTGTTAAGKAYNDRISGSRLINTLNLPFLLSLPSSKPEKKGHILAGSVVTIRVFARDRFAGSRTFPADTLVIPIDYRDPGNNAIDLFGVHAALGYRYRFHPRLEAIGMLRYKMLGFSTGDENFLSANQQTFFISARLLFRFGRMEHLPFF